MLNKLIDRPVAVTMFLLVALILGTMGFRKLPVSLIPDIDIPYITVQATDASLSARQMDEAIVRPLREQLIQVGGLQDIITESRDGSGQLRLSFNHGENIDYQLIEVNEKIDRCVGSLPDIDRPKVFRANASDLPAFYLDISLKDSSQRSFLQLSQFTEEVIARRLEQLPEVAMVDITGLADEQVLILPNTQLLAQAGLSMDDFETALRSADIRIGSLSIKDGEYRFNVKFDSHTNTAEDIGDIWLRSGSRLLQVKDLAKVSQQAAPRSGLARSNGREAVNLAIIKQSEARMADLKSAMEALFTSFQSDYPDIKFTLTRDQTQLLDYTIRNLLASILLAVLLASIVIFFFMQDFRSPALVSVTMPLALVSSMLIFYITGLSLNILSLSGLLLGVGMMADNTIILVDNITARWKRDGVLRNAVVEGTREVSGPMLSSLLTTCAVFVPLSFVNGLAGALFKDEALAVTIVLFTSYLLTIAIIPVFYYNWNKKRAAFQAHHLLQQLSFEDTLLRWDGKAMSWFLDHRKAAWGIIGLSTVGMAMLLLLMPKERLPKMTRTETILKVDWNQPLDLKENESRTALLEEHGKALQISSLVGPQQFVLSHSDEQTPSETAIYFACRSQDELEQLEQRIGDFLRREYPWAVWTFSDAENLFDIVFAADQAPLTARLRPASVPDITVETLRPLLNRIRHAIPETEFPGIPTKADVILIPQLDKMALYGVEAEELTTALRNVLNINQVFTIRQGSKPLPVITGNGRGELEELLTQTYIEKRGYRIPVYELVRQSYGEDLKTITSGPEGTYYPLDMAVNSREVPGLMNAISSVVQDDRHFDVSFSGSFFSNREMAKEMLVILLIAVTLLYLILAAQFESLLQPIIILLEIVTDLAAVLAILWLLGLTLNMMSLIGMVVVTGIVINDSILKIDTINRLRREGAGLRNAILLASGRRMKAILMTSLTTILAMVPLLTRGSMGADLQYSLSLAVIIGMSIGTPVSLFIIPTLYYSVYHGKE